MADKQPTVGQQICQLPADELPTVGRQFSQFKPVQC